MSSKSASATANAESGSPYRRDNWWFSETGHPGHGEDDVDAGESDEQDDAGPHIERPGTSRAEWIAHKVLKATAPLICPITANADPDEDDLAMHEVNHEIELTDPELYVEASGVDVGDGKMRKMYGDHRRHRYNPVYGYITGPQIADQPTEQFLQVVDIVLELGMLNEGLREKTADRIRTLARVRKGAGDDDVSIMTEVVRCVESPGLLDEKGF